MLILLLLGFSSGMPLYLTSRTLSAWLTQAGVDLASIGFLSLVGLPYSLKFLWSPLVDRYSLSARIGRRRSWLLATQIALLIGIVSMALGNPQSMLLRLAVSALLVAFFSATQDIVVDAYRADVVNAKDAAAGASVWVVGYRVALLLTGGGAFVLAEWFSWPVSYVMMAACMGVGIVATALAPEAPIKALPHSLSEAVVSPFHDFFRRLGPQRALGILLFALLYRMGDSMLRNMATPFLLQSGYTASEVGAVQGGVGLFATIVGVLIGGALTARWGILRALWIFGVLQAASNLAYWMLSVSDKDLGLLISAITIENLCDGLVTSTFLAYLMQLCNPSFSATQYALLSSLMAVGRDVLASPSGWLAAAVGWPAFFGWSVAASVPGLLLLALSGISLIADKGAGDR